MKKLFKNSHPKLYLEVHPSKNKNIDFSNVYENSGRQIWWMCLKNSNHVWQQAITNRTKKNYGCPYCTGRKTLPEDSFAALYPEIAAEIHPEKNKKFDPYKCRPKSNKKIWWKCKEGHEWQQKINARVTNRTGCKFCRRIENSLAKKYPEIAAEWHPTKNKDLCPEDMIISSKKRVWWKCKEDHTHEWQVSVHTRVYSKTGCPICTKLKKEQKEYPTLDLYSPSLADQWHPTKNGDFKPSHYKPNSSTIVWWRCPINPAHEWKSIIRNRALQGKGCPYCSKNRVTEQNSFLICFPIMAKQWHQTKNGTLKPSDFSYGSSKKVWWQCEKDKTHEWQSTIVSRTQQNKIECPICSKSTYAISNSLQAIHPEIAAQWHPTKNGDLKPEQVSRASGKKVWWICKENNEHEWIAQIKNRTILGAGCPICSKEKNIIRLSEHLYDLVHTDIDYYHVFLRNMRMLRKFVDFDIVKSRETSQSFFRMIYTSVITSLEVYLSDAFCIKLFENEDFIEIFIMNNPEFNKRQYSLSEVIDWKKNIDKKITEYLFNIIWHNLPKIQHMYKQVLAISFPDDISHLHEAVAIRHDLVHRNGRTKKGYEVKITKHQIIKLIEDVTEFVSAINDQVESI